MLESTPWNESQGYFEALRPRNKGMTSSTHTSNLRLASTYCSNLLTGIGAPLAKLQADLKEFIALLNSHGVEYILVGGHAVAYHGHPHSRMGSVAAKQASGGAAERPCRRRKIVSNRKAQKRRLTYSAGGKGQPLGEPGV
jgi:hypothetical protein